MPHPAPAAARGPGGASGADAGTPTSHALQDPLSPVEEQARPSTGGAPAVDPHRLRPSTGAARPEAPQESAVPATVGSWPAQAQSVPQARRMVRRLLLEEHQAELLDAAELLVTELVSNVVLHVGGEVQVAAQSVAGEVVIEVSDTSPVRPRLRSFSSTASTGRGMRLVQALAADHGVHPHGTGKTVWVRVTRARAEQSDEELGAQFTGVDWLAGLDDGAPGAQRSA